MSSFVKADKILTSRHDRKPPQNMTLYGAERHPAENPLCTGCIHNDKPFPTRCVRRNKVKIPFICRRCIRWLKMNGEHWFKDRKKKPKTEKVTTKE